MRLLIRCFFLLSICAALSLASASEVVVEASATIHKGDIGQARELATRRALARAAEFKSANVSAQAVVRPGVVLDSVQVRASACTENAEQISERISAGELTVVIKVSVQDGDCHMTCRGAYTNRLLVTGFAMEFPEQKLMSEEVQLSQLTAVELSRKITQHRRLLADYKSTAFPYASPSRAPEPFLTPRDSESPFAILARKFRAQYVLSGVYRDFGLRGWSLMPHARRIQIEAFLHDGVNGEVLARHVFTQEAVGSVVMANKPAIGSAEFYSGGIGRVWGDVLEDIAHWAETQASCLPFIARVLKVTGNQIHIDGGAESGLSAGDTLTIHNWREPAVFGANDLFLGKEKSVRSSASIRAVYPRFSVIEITDAPANLSIKVGDVLYAQ